MEKHRNVLQSIRKTSLAWDVMHLFPFSRYDFAASKLARLCHPVKFSNTSALVAQT